MKYKNTLGLVKSNDLSSNKLRGEIPRKITELIGLISLNLSRNNFNGTIPSENSVLKSLDTLDLSNNHLIGKIPSRLSQVDRLGVLDLSNNNLSGEIPISTQLQSFGAKAYTGILEFVEHHSQIVLKNPRCLCLLKKLEAKKMKTSFYLEDFTSVWELGLSLDFGEFMAH